MTQENSIWSKTAAIGLTYAGDSDVACGGVFYDMNSDDYSNGYISAVRIEPCSAAGAQYNAFWLEWLTVNIPESLKDTLDVLRTCGMVIDRAGHIMDESSFEIIAEKGTPEFMQVIAECCVSYGRYEKDNGLTIQVGYKADGGNKSERIRASDIDVWLSDKTDFEAYLLNKISDDSEKNALASACETDRDALRAESRLQESLERQSSDCGACPFRGKDCLSEDCPDTDTDI